MDDEKAKVIETLLKIQNLFSNKANWTQNYFAKSKAGKTINFESNEAVCFCLVGAVLKFANSQSSNPVGGIILNELHYTLKSLNKHHDSIISFNDSADYDDVIFILEETINRINKEGITMNVL